MRAGRVENGSVACMNDDHKPLFGRLDRPCAVVPTALARSSALSLSSSATAVARAVPQCLAARASTRRGRRSRCHNVLAEMLARRAFSLISERSHAFTSPLMRPPPIGSARTACRRRRLAAFLSSLVQQTLVRSYAPAATHTTFGPSATNCDLLRSRGLFQSIHQFIGST